MHAELKPRPLIVVLVDDDPDVLRSLQFAFEVEGFLVDAYANGEDLLERAPILGPGCLVLDYHLGGIDGLALLARLRARGNRLPAILITTPTLDLKARATRAGVALIEKPLLCDTLVGEARRLVDAAYG